MKRLLAPGLGLAAALLLATACGGGSPGAVAQAGVSPSRAVSSAATKAPTASPSASATGQASHSATLMPSGPLLIIRPAVVPSTRDYGVVMPTVIGVAADVNLQLRNLHWTSWTAVEATGWGDAVADNCNPDCAQGTIKLIRISIVLSDTVDGDYSFMSWGNGTTINNKLHGVGILLSSEGGRQVPVSDVPSQASSPTLVPTADSSPTPVPTTKSGTHNYNDMAQLDPAVAASVARTSGLTVTSASCVVWPTLAYNYTCTLHYATAGTEEAHVVVPPDGSSFTIVSGG